MTLADLGCRSRVIIHRAIFEYQSLFHFTVFLDESMIRIVNQSLQTDPISIATFVGRVELHVVDIRLYVIIMTGMSDVERVHQRLLGLFWDSIHACFVEDRICDSVDRCLGHAHYVVSTNRL